MKVVVDIEAIGRLPSSVFLIAFQVDDSETKLFHLIPEEDFPGAKNWWMGDESRKAFLEKCMEKRGPSRCEVAKEIRSYVDSLYERDPDLVFYSDYAIFDIGMTNAILAEYGLLPLYLRHDTTCPADTIDMVTYANGLACRKPNGSSNDAFKNLLLERPMRDKGHDSTLDVKTIMQEVNMLERKQEELCAHLSS